LVEDPQQEEAAASLSAADLDAITRCSGLTHLTLSLPPTVMALTPLLAALPRLSSLIAPRVTALAAPLPGALKNLHVSWDCVPQLTHLGSLTSLALSSSSYVNVATCEYLSTLTALRRLDLSSPMRWALDSQHIDDAADKARITGAALEPLSPLTALQHLLLSGCSRIDNDALVHLLHFRALTALDLSVCRSIDGGAIKLLVSLPSLVHLDLSWSDRVGGGNMAMMQWLTRLDTLMLSSCIALDDESVSHIAMLTALTRLGLRACARVTVNGMRHLQALTQLQWLELSSTTAPALGALSSMTRLTHLMLRGFKCLRGSEALWPVGRLTRLHHLTVDSCPNIGTPSFQQLCHLTALTELVIRFCPVDDGDLELLQPLTNLRKLWVQGSRHIHGGGLRHLCRCTLLHEISLQQCESLDACGLAFLGGLRQLAWLNIARCGRIEPEDFARLPQLGELQHLIVVGPEGEAAAALRELGFRVE
jgi:F-box and leucine-rich repeat protein 14